jgi:hypothetical protein
MRQRAGAIFHVETGDAERLCRRGDAACNRLGGSDIE